jgi:hypothetical protein
MSEDDSKNRRTVLKSIGAAAAASAGLAGLASGESSTESSPCECSYEYKCMDGRRYKRECCVCDTGEEACGSWTATNYPCI